MSPREAPVESPATTMRRQEGDEPRAQYAALEEVFTYYDRFAVFDRLELDAPRASVSERAAPPSQPSA